MAKWFPPMILMALIQTTNLEGDGSCQTHLSAFRWPQITCTNVDSRFFQSFTVPLNRTHWIKCANCTLDVIDEKTFDFTRNNVSYLELQSCRIRSLEKLAFNRFFLLKTLNLRRNELSSIQADAFIGLKRLLHLDLSSNYLTILTDNMFAGLVNLDILNLNKNQIFHVQPYAFTGLVNLKYLYLNNNDLKRLDERMFRDLSNLKILYLEHNQIVEIHQNCFVDLENLNYLYLNNNSISFLVQYNFKPLTSLVDLQLRYNNLSEIQVSSFNGLKNLRYLYLSNNKISAVKPYGFIGLDSLEVLDLVRNNFERIEYSYFDKIENLQILWLNNNSISNFDINYKSEVQKSLVVLDLSHNNISSYDYELFYEKMPNIKEIVLEQNCFSCDFFVSMFNYYRDKNVSICISSWCDYNETLTYIDDICPEEYPTTTENTIHNSTDLSTDCASAVFVKTLLFVHCIISSTLLLTF
ncbi:uncharacterized protein LOC143191825 [Rhynchophorus ferrugineus]|uniref:uncharacterized protein LOC143191825 n=1 Tax=Rhynchophorus ferrugineus TaxID=354439 RepID=UPI003FCC3FA4